MTIREKDIAIKEFCDATSCSLCPLYESNKYRNCFGEGADIEANFALLNAYGDNFMSEPQHSDNVNHPKHYGSGKFECIDVMIETQGIEAVKAFCLCNALKYLYRHNNKNGVEDIRKARWYIDKYLELEGDTNE